MSINKVDSSVIECENEGKGLGIVLLINNCEGLSSKVLSSVLSSLMHEGDITKYNKYY